MGRSGSTINRVTIAGLVGIILCLIGLNIYSFTSKPKTAFVKGTELFAEFQGKKELEARFTKSETEQQSMLDTLTLEIANLTNELTETPKSQDLQRQKTQKEQLYMELQNRFSQQNASQNQQYTEAIWKQINEYTLEYGKKHGYGLYQWEGQGKYVMDGSSHLA